MTCSGCGAMVVGAGIGIVLGVLCLPFVWWALDKWGDPLLDRFFAWWES